MLKAVIFDFDGILADTTPLHQEANIKLLNHFHTIRLPSIGGREGMRIIDILQDYKDIYNLPGSIVEIYQIRQKFFYEIVDKKLKINSDVYDLMDKLKLKKLKIALGTSADRHYMNIVFDKYPKLAKYFVAIVTGDDVLRGKPYPDIYQKVIDELNILPHEAVVIEDSVNGIIAAKRAQIPVVCVPNKHYPDSDYSIADKIFTSLKELSYALVLN